MFVGCYLLMCSHKHKLKSAIATVQDCYDGKWVTQSYGASLSLEDVGQLLIYLGSYEVCSVAPSNDGAYVQYACTTSTATRCSQETQQRQ
jgi:hypothetical protein